MIGSRIRIKFSIALVAATPAALGVSSCGSGDLPLEVVDPLAAPMTPTFDQVREILDRRCLSCHDGGGEADEGEAEDLDYSTCGGIVTGVEGILRTAVFGGSMPPGALPRLTEREKLIIHRWAEQGACAPCNSCL